MRQLSHRARVVRRILRRADWFPPLFSRAVLGWIFTESGWGKFQHLDKVIGFFQQLNIPAPQLQAPLVAGLELAGGILLLFGLLTRFACIPLSAIMSVALVTAKSEDIASVSDLLGMSEFLYLGLLIWLLFVGAGRFSLDARFFDHQRG